VNAGYGECLTLGDYVLAYFRVCISVLQREPDFVLGAIFRCWEAAEASDGRRIPVTVATPSRGARGRHQSNQTTQRFKGQAGSSKSWVRVGNGERIRQPGRYGNCCSVCRQYKMAAARNHGATGGGQRRRRRQGGAAWRKCGQYPPGCCATSPPPTAPGQ